MPHSPALRDSTMLFRPWLNAPKGAGAGWRAWRLQVTQPGAWMLHCHTLAHMIMGMQSVWVFGDEEDLMGLMGNDRKQVEGYLQYGGRAYGNETSDACYRHHFGDEDED